MTRASFTPTGQTAADATRASRAARQALRRLEHGLGLTKRQEAMTAWLAMCYGGKPTRCINCGELGSHFAPPSFGEAGFFICKAKL